MNETSLFFSKKKYVIIIIIIIIITINFDYIKKLKESGFVTEFLMLLNYYF